MPNALLTDIKYQNGVDLSDTSYKFTTIYNSAKEGKIAGFESFSKYKFNFVNDTRNPIRTEAAAFDSYNQLFATQIRNLWNQPNGSEQIARLYGQTIRYNGKPLTEVQLQQAFSGIVPDNPLNKDTFGMLRFASELQGLKQDGWNYALHHEIAGNSVSANAFYNQGTGVIAKVLDGTNPTSFNDGIVDWGSDLGAGFNIYNPGGFNLLKQMDMTLHGADSPFAALKDLVITHSQGGSSAELYGIRNKQTTLIFDGVGAKHLRDNAIRAGQLLSTDTLPPANVYRFATNKSPIDGVLATTTNNNVYFTSAPKLSIGHSLDNFDTSNIGVPHDATVAQVLTSFPPRPQQIDPVFNVLRRTLSPVIDPSEVILDKLRTLPASTLQLLKGQKVDGSSILDARTQGNTTELDYFNPSNGQSGTYKVDKSTGKVTQNVDLNGDGKTDLSVGFDNNNQPLSAQGVSSPLLAAMNGFQLDANGVLKYSPTKYQQAIRQNQQAAAEEAKATTPADYLNRTQKAMDANRGKILSTGFNRPDLGKYENIAYYKIDNGWLDQIDLRNGKRIQTEDLNHMQPADQEYIAGFYFNKNLELRDRWSKYSAKVNEALGQPKPLTELGLAQDPLTVIPVTPNSFIVSTPIPPPRSTYVDVPDVGLQTFENNQVVYRPYTYSTSTSASIAPNAYYGGYNLGGPLVLDLNNDGIKTIGRINQATYFDMDKNDTSPNASDVLNRTGWLSAGDGFLALDKNNNSKIDSISELIGGFNPGFKVLMDMDINKDGFVDNVRDAVNFNKLLIWQDKNSNAITDVGELNTLAAWGIVSISAASIVTRIDYLADGNVITQHCVFKDVNNVNRTISDVYFEYSKTDILKPVNNGSSTFNTDLLALPWLRGEGLVDDLILAMSTDASLKATMTYFQSTGAVTAYGLMDSMLIQWANVQSYSTTVWEDGMVGLSVQRASLLRNFYNVSIGVHTDDADITLPIMDQAYSVLKEKMYLSLEAQSELGQSIGLNYDYASDLLSWEFVNKSDELGVALLQSSDSIFLYNKAINYFNTLGMPNLPAFIQGGIGADTLTGSSNVQMVDILDAGAGNDTMLGGLGNDVYLFKAGFGNDIISDTGGNDSIVLDPSFSSGDLILQTTGFGDVFLTNPTTGQFIRIMNPVGYGSGGLTAIEASISQRIESLVYSNVFDHYQDFSTLYVTNPSMNDSANTFWGTSYNDRYFGFGGADTLMTASGDDYVSGGLGNDTIDSGSGMDLVFGDDGNDILSGGSDNDIISGGGGSDTLTGGTGNDLLQGGVGSDLYKGFSGTFGLDVLSDESGVNDRLDLSNWSTSDVTRWSASDRDTNGYLESLIIEFSTYGTIIIDDYFTNTSNINSLGSGIIETITFGSGTVLNYNAVQQLLA